MAGEEHGAVSYASYLALDTLLASQHPRSGAHDELLFIIVHQASELWLKLALHELAPARDAILAQRPRPSFKMLARVARAQEQLISSWDVLATLTPADYAAVRPFLGPSSGFQSVQYRLLEFLFGARDPKVVSRHSGAEAQALAAELARPSLYDATLALLAARGLQVPLRTRFDTPHHHDAQIEAAWAAVYRDPEAHWDLYELAEKLVDLETNVQRWRFAHLKTVERVIGLKRGTGGTAGSPYLETVLRRGFFPELMSVRTAL